MNLEIIEHHPRRVLEAFRRGEFDQLEILGEADERDFFELCLREKILPALAEPMPSARKKEEVPGLFHLMANLSLKLHRENSFSAFERVVRYGGLLSALDPSVASKHLDAETQQWVLRCEGFNQKNRYERRTPCDQDTLRKAVKDVEAERWSGWFDGPVQQVFGRYGFFDPAGVFVGDGSYLFVPDNPNYEGSVVMWFDEHNHPVKLEELSPAQRAKAHRERCYKLVSLLHLRGEHYVYAVLAVVPGNAHELPVLYELVDDFVATMGVGVMKKLILDRGFIDGRRISRCKRDLGIDVLIPIKKRMDLWSDAWALGRAEAWAELPPEKARPKPVPAGRPADLRRREAKRQQTLARKKAEEPAPDPAAVLRRRECCAIKGFGSWSAATVPIHVLLLREEYADGHREEWALMSTEDCEDPVQLYRDYLLRPKIEERHRVLKCFHDLSDFRSTCFNVIVAQVVFILLSYTLRQWQLWKHFAQEELAGRTPEAMRRRLNRRREYVVIYHQKAYCQMPLATFARELLELEAAARQKALAKVRQLEGSLLSPLENIRPPP